MYFIRYERETFPFCDWREEKMKDLLEKLHFYRLTLSNLLLGPVVAGIRQENFQMLVDRIESWRRRTGI